MWAIFQGHGGSIHYQCYLALIGHRSENTIQFLDLHNKSLLQQSGIQRLFWDNRIKQIESETLQKFGFSSNHILEPFPQILRQTWAHSRALSNSSRSYWLTWGKKGGWTARVRLLKEKSRSNHKLRLNTSSLIQNLRVLETFERQIELLWIARVCLLRRCQEKRWFASPDKRVRWNPSPARKGWTILGDGRQSIRNVVKVDWWEFALRWSSLTSWHITSDSCGRFRQTKIALKRSKPMITLTCV